MTRNGDRITRCRQFEEFVAQPGPSPDAWEGGLRMNMVEDSAAALHIIVNFVGGPSKGPPGVFDAVFREAAKIEGPEGRELEVVAHFGASRFPGYPARQRHSHLASAATIARGIKHPSDTLDTVDLTSEALVAMEENALAIAWCNQAVALTKRNATAAAGRLWRAGRCYLRAGFRSEAPSLPRTAVEALRANKNARLLPLALVDLGNSALDLAPLEAEPAYREAAELLTRAGRDSQAATAWTNLGVLCSRADRLDEAIDWYEKVGALREADQRSTVAQLGIVHINLASVWRKKRDFVRARAEAERALDILRKTTGAPLAHAHGTMGEIARDEGRDEESLDWFQRARKQFERQPSPSVEGLATKLENEATALEKLGHRRRAARLRARIETLKAVAPPVTPPLPEARPAVSERSDGTKGQVIITLDGRGLPDEIYRICDLATLESRLETRLEREGGGELDGHEHGPETTRIFLYGPDARALLDVIMPVLRDYPLCQGARVELRQGAEAAEFGLADT
ncbi:MAG TPA: tetratricopeptide repeat protein [Caulobacteraceae bacterium]|jgi:tetratricopeptide (TPR) repeat protein